jgi:hypothetical protein
VPRAHTQRARARPPSSRACRSSALTPPARCTYATATTTASAKSHPRA